jgi:hypothetical protein
MLQLQNSTRFAASMALFPNEDAIDTLYVIVKATFNFGREFTLADEQTPPTAADVYWTEPGKSSIRYASDMHTGKPATDIIMLGHACVPGQKEATVLDVSLTVGKVSKTVQVFGNRQWQDGQITRPAPFKTMAMVYEKAYGGVHIVNGQLADTETRNPLGRGFAGARKPDEMNGVPLPNLEDPAQLIRNHNDQPAPACFGFCAPNWQPRVSFAGTYDDNWKKNRAPYLPEDFDQRFHNMAHPDLVYPGYLQGNEPVTITHMHPDGAFKFDLPQVNPITRVQVAERIEQPAFNLETLILEPNQRKLSMVWRAAMPCDKQMLKIREIKIGQLR